VAEGGCAGVAVGHVRKARSRHLEADARDCTYSTPLDSDGYCRPAMTPPSTERMTPVIHFA
jgi:hypothetical protein